MTITICRGPAMKTMHREYAGERWCFTCRSRVSFDYEVLAPIEPSYYGLLPRIICRAGHLDGDLGFGRVREWDA